MISSKGTKITCLGHSILSVSRQKLGKRYIFVHFLEKAFTLYTRRWVLLVGQGVASPPCSTASSAWPRCPLARCTSTPSTSGCSTLRSWENSWLSFPKILSSSREPSVRISILWDSVLTDNCWRRWRKQSRQTQLQNARKWQWNQVGWVDESSWRPRSSFRSIITFSWATPTALLGQVSFIVYYRSS